MSHTPGPWSVDMRWEHAILIIPAADSKLSAGMHFVDPTSHRRDHLRPLASLKLKPYKFDGISDEEHAANGRLIAAAPELLEACKYALINCKPSNFSDAERREFLGRLSAAIGKAEGK